MDKVDLPKILKTSLLGAGLGAAAGVGFVLMKSRKSTQPDGDPLQSAGEPMHERIINLKHAPDANEAVTRMFDYRPLHPEAYQAIRLNLDRIVGLHILVAAPGPCSASYEIKASRYRNNIQEALKLLAKRYRGEPSKQFLEDTDALLKCADNYVYNINQQMREKFASGHVTSM